MAVTLKKRGFSLLIAVIFMSVMLAFGLALGSIAYKQITLASTATDSQYAFYAADAGLECGLYADQQLVLFATQGASPPAMTCENASPVSSSQTNVGPAWIVNYRFNLNTSTRCADVYVYKYSPAQVIGGKTVSTYIFSQGYSVACSQVGVSTRAVSRGESSYY